MKDILIAFAREHLLPLVIMVGWYILAGVIAALFAKKTRIDAWCAANPRLAFALNMLRASGFDVWKVIAAAQTLARSKAGLPPIVPTVTLLIGLSLVHPGCSLETARQTRVNSQLQAERAGRTTVTRPEAECKALDSFHVYTLYGAEFSLGVGVAAGIIAAKSEGKIQDAALATGVTTAAIAGGLAYVSQRSGSQWAERCGQ